MKLFSYLIYKTKAEGGINGDGRVGIDWGAGDLTLTEVHIVIDAFTELARKMSSGATGDSRAAIVDTEFGQ